MRPHQQLRHLHRMLAVAARIVPSAEREQWRQEWIAELTYALQADPAGAQELARGMVPDAWTLRLVGWRRRVHAVDWRSPGTCLQVLTLSFLFLAVSSGLQPHVRHLVFSKWGYGAFACFLSLTLLTLPSTVVTRASRFGDYGVFHFTVASTREMLGRWRFLAAKLVLVVLVTYLLSLQITRPFMRLLGARADWLLMFCGLLLNVFAMRWVLLDQKARCPTCMRLLRSPASMGPPSWSFLHWSGMEEMCDRGHGLLQLPHWETSWSENPRWLQLDHSWSELFHP